MLSDQNWIKLFIDNKRRNTFPTADFLLEKKKQEQKRQQHQGDEHKILIAAVRFQLANSTAQLYICVFTTRDWCTAL